MSDIVKRLRNWSEGPNTYRLTDEAADIIEEQRGALSIAELAAAAEKRRADALASAIVALRDIVTTEHESTADFVDRELLERAAKAAGIVIVGTVDACVAQPNDEHVGGFVVRNDKGGDSCWNPLRDDGDAFRLAVKLEIEIRVFNGQAHAGKQNKFWVTESWFPDGEQYAATRRAIVRAAAAIGERQQ